MSGDKRWSVWRKFIVIPLFLVVGIELLCAWIIWDDTVSHPQIADGSPDDSPRMGALFLGFLVPVIYFIYVGVILCVRSVASGRTTDRT